MSTKFRRRTEPSTTGDMIRIRMLSVLNGYLDQGVTQVGIKEMLDLLDPAYVLPAQRPQDPLADPLTGAMPVLPQAYRPPSA